LTTPAAVSKNSAFKKGLKALCAGRLSAAVRSLRVTTS
jgi:hypothetical protein